MFLQPEKVPVKVYLSTDKDAPRLDRTPNCVATILKACLVTGYGDKEGAGWSLPFEDDVKGVKVLKPADSPHIPFFMRLSNDTGKSMTVQVYQEMTNIDDGQLKLSLSNNRTFVYNQDNSSGRWLLIATERSFYFASEMGSISNRNKNGSALYCGDTAKNTRGERAVALLCTSYYSLVSSSSNQQASLLTKEDKVGVFRPKSYFDGSRKMTNNTLVSPVLLEFEEEIYGVPIYMASNTMLENYQVLQAYQRTFINHGQGTGTANNSLIPIDYWEY